MKEKRYERLRTIKKPKYKKLIKNKKSKKKDKTKINSFDFSVLVKLVRRFLYLYKSKKILIVCN